MNDKDYLWKPGQSGNPNGRPSGARNKSSYELREKLKERGDRDPAEFLSEVISNENEPEELRIAASNVLMPYYHSKLGAIHVPPPPQYIEQAISLPRPIDVVIVEWQQPGQPVEPDQGRGGTPDARS